MEDLVADTHAENIVERLMAHEGDGDSGHQAKTLPAAKPIRTVVLRLANDDALAGSKLVQRLQIALRQVAVRRRNRMAVRIFKRLAKVVRNRLLEPRRDRVLQRLGLGVNFAPVEPEHAREKKLHKA